MEPVAEEELRLEVRREDITHTRVREQPLPELKKGEALFEVERFSVTANNVTYGALMGEQLGYWNLFPAPPGWGQIPVWGYLRTLESRVPGLAPGRRAYGFCPPSSHAILTPGRVSDEGFLDAAPHRAPLGTVYNSYAWLDTDPAFEPGNERHLLVLRPLFWLSYMLVEELALRQIPEQHDLLITSASSKAAIGTAYLLAERGMPAPIALTSPANVKFVESLGLYGEVCAYPELTSLERRKAALLDIAGSSETRVDIERHYGTELVETFVAGGTHVDADGTDPSSGQFFFVPERMRSRAKEIGWSELNNRYCREVKKLAQDAREWLEVDTVDGPEPAAAAYAQIVANLTPPTRTFLLSLRQAPSRR
jgi:hypothetical protein